MPTQVGPLRRNNGPRKSLKQRNRLTLLTAGCSRRQTIVTVAEFPMPERARYLLVDAHSIIFAWPELRKLHQRRSALAREALIKQLRDYQDWTGVRVVAVFDGKGGKVESTAHPADVQVFYSRRGQSADAIIERLANKYSKRYEIVVATSDSMVAETVHASDADWISPEGLRGLLSSARPS